MKVNRTVLQIGIILMTGLTLTDCSSEKKKESTRTMVIEKVSMEPLDLTDRSAFYDQLEKMCEDGGIETVIKWAKEELVPGREIITADISDQQEVRHIYDRSLWHLDDQKRPTTEAILRPLKEESVFSSMLLGPMSFPFIKTPFQIRIRVYLKENDLSANN